jgi:TolB-like protein
VLVSSIRRSGEKTRVTVQLVNVADGASIWADRFDENYTGSEDRHWLAGDN